MQRSVMAILLGALVVTGCAGSLSGSSYERGQARTPQDVQFGVVEHVRTVRIEGTKSGVGATAGGVMGGVAGAASGRSQVGKTVGGVAGGVVGGLAGAAAEEGLTRQKGYEITVRLESGRIIALVQAADEEFRVGERVRVLSGGGVTRVSH